MERKEDNTMREKHSMNKSLNLLSLLLALLLLSGFSSGEADYSNINPQEAKKMIALSKEGLLVLDVRTEGEYNESHLKNSTLIPIQVLAERVGEINGYKNKDIIVYCAVGGRSSRASGFLIGQGFKKVYNMVGGFNEWSRLGYDFEK